MSWTDYLQWRGEMSDIADATTGVTTLLLERAPGGSDIFEYMTDTAPVVLSSYAQSAQGSAAAYVGRAQRAAGLAPVVYRPAPAMITAAAVQPVVKWALTDVAMPWAIEEVLPRAAQGATRLVLNAGRDAVIDGAEHTGQSVTWKRVPRADACAYCRMMSQWTYERKADAERTVTRFGYTWRDRKGRSRWRAYDAPSAARGSKQGAGSPFHGNCRCEPAAIFGDWDQGGVPDDIEDRWTLFSEQWDSAYNWARDRQPELRRELWEEIQSRPGSSERKLEAWRQERRTIPNLQTLALGHMRSELGIR